MLILTRRPGQVLNIGDEITVTVLSVVGAQVRIGIDAPRDMNVLREEAIKRTPRQPRDYADGNR